MTKKIHLALVLALSAFTVSAQAADQYFMRVPAPAKCANSSCVMGTAPAPVTIPEVAKPELPQGTIAAVTSLDFGVVSTVAGTNASLLDFVFTNTGSVPISGAYGTANGAGLAMSSARLYNTCGLIGVSLATIQPGATCKIRAAFKPTASGAFTGNVSLVNGDGAQVATVTVRGTGGTGIVSLSTDTLDFGTLALGSSAVKTLTVTNTGTAPVLVGGYSVWTDDDLAAITYVISSNTCQTVSNLLPSKSCAFTITATANKAGVYSATFYPTAAGAVRPAVPIKVTVQ